MEAERTEGQLADLVSEEMSGEKKPKTVKGLFPLPDLMRHFNICINYTMCQNLISSILPLPALLFVVRQK